MITGQCLCGAVHYTAKNPPFVTRACWCRLCQRIGAGSCTVNAGFHTADITITGRLTEYSCTADSGTLMHRGFCPVCGTPMTSRAETRPTTLFLRAGTLNDPELARPAMTIWTKEAPSWACIAEDIPRIEAQPPPA